MSKNNKQLERVFTFRNSEVRIMQKDGQPWFVAKDVCDILSISNSRDAIASLDEDERADVAITDTSSNGTLQRRNVNIISESGLYALIFQSRKPEAKEFRRWVTGEVLPAIRETGSYGGNSKSGVDMYTYMGLLGRDVLKLREELASYKYATIESMLIALQMEHATLQTIITYAKKEGAKCQRPAHTSRAKAEG